MKTRRILAILFISAILSCVAAGCSLFPDDPTPTPPQTPFVPGVPVYFEYTVNNDEVTLTRYTGTGTAVSIPSLINGMPVTGIGTYCFSGAATRITSLYIPATIKSLGSYMCYNVDTLESVTFENENNIEHIGYRVIGNTPAEAALLEENDGIYSIGKFVVRVQPDDDDIIEIPSNLTRIAGGAFENVSAKEVIFHENFEHINASDIYKAMYIECITIESETMTISGGTIFTSDSQYIRCTPDSVAEKYAIDEGLFYEIIGEENAWDYKVRDGAAIITTYSGTSKNIRIPSRIDDYVVQEIGDGINRFTYSDFGKLYIPKTVTKINSNFVCGADSLENISFENVRTLKEIGSDAFKDTAFENKTNVKDGMSIVGTILTRHFGTGNIILPDNITAISGRAFGEAVESITVNEGCTWFADDMLYNCNNIKWIYIPNTMLRLKKVMFDVNNDIVIKCDAVAYAAEFAKNNGLKCETVYYWDYTLNDADMTAYLIQYTGSQKNVTVPSKIGDYTVTSLGSIRNTSIESLWIPQTVTRIEDLFAYSVFSLETVRFEDVSKVEYIGAQAFYGTLYEAVESMDNGMHIINNILVGFAGKGDVVIPDYVQTIAPMAFYKSNVTSVTVPESCLTIGERAFAGCELLEWVYIPDSVNNIKLYILEGSENAYIKCHMNSIAHNYARENGYEYLIVEYNDWDYEIIDDRIILRRYNGTRSNVIVPSQLHGYIVVGIGESCFADTYVSSVYIHFGIESIGDRAFDCCTRLEEVLFEDTSTIKQIGDYIFVNTPYFNNIEEENGIYDINGILVKCTVRNEVKLPYYITHISGGAFNNNEAVSVEVNEGCTGIGYGAFGGMYYLERVYIPDGVADFGDNILNESNENAKIVCHNNSSALDYAISAGYKYEIIENEYEYDVVSEDSITYAVLTKYTGTDTELSLPLKIDGYDVGAIGDACFADNDITFMYVHKGISKIGGNICRPSLKTVIFEDEFAVSYIAKDAFKGTEFETANMDSNGLSIIGSIITASNASGDVVLPDIIEVLSGSAFNSNKYITSVTLNEGCKTIKAPAFADAEKLLWIYIPDSVTYIEDGILDGTYAYIKCNAGSYAEQYAIKNRINYVLANQEYDWEYVVTDGSVTLQKYKGTALDVIVPSHIGGTPVTTIGKWCFINTSIESVYVPGTVTTIGEEAFNGVSSLKKITFANEASIEDIADGAFDGSGIIDFLADEHGFAMINGILVGCTASGDIVLDVNVKKIAGRAFYGNNNITSVTINSSCISIGYQAFAYIDSLEWIVIPASVEEIFGGIFSEDMNVTIKCYYGSLAYYYAQSKNYTTELIEIDYEYIVEDDHIVLVEYKGIDKNVIIPSVIENLPVRVIDDECFAGKQIESVWIPKTVTKIGNKAFYGASALGTVTFDDEKSIVSIGNRAFGETLFENITGVDSRGVVQINGILIRHFGSGNITLPDEIKHIAGGAFFDRQDITYVKINNGCESIDENAFSFMYSIESVYIPESVVNIESGSFSNCNEKLYIVCKADSAAEKFATENNIPYRIMK